MSEKRDSAKEAIIRDHRRQWRECLYVYPVISRRAEGLSIGVNLNPNKGCTFSCLYCQINRTVDRNLHRVDLETLRRELREALEAAVSGSLWKEERFAGVPESMRRINDIALSGDGEPTCLVNFDQAVQVAADVKREFSLENVKIVVITNSTQFDAPQFQRALPVLDSNEGEIWAKLDAGTEPFFQRTNRPDPVISLERIVENIAAVARRRPVVIQTLFFRLDGATPPKDELDAYCARLREIVDSGGTLKLIQLHTIARPPQDASVSALSNSELEGVAEIVRAALPAVRVESYYGQNVKPQQT